MANKNGNPQNLKNLADRPKEERIEIAKAGAAAAVEARRKKKAMKEQLETLLALPSQNKKALSKMKALGIDDENADNQMQMLVSIFLKACTGDTFAANFIRDTVGEKPTDKHAVEVNTGLLDDIVKQLDED